MSGATRVSADSIRKLVRFTAIYGPGRTLFKAAGRLRISPPKLALTKQNRDVAVIGCGQFAFATISYFLQREFGNRIVACYDINRRARDTFARAMRVARACDSADELFAHPGVRTVYVASNHASHAPYAIEAIRRGLDVYVEKPIAVTEDQLEGLLAVLQKSRSRIFAGYNRPFSGAIRDLRRLVQIVPEEGISLQCFVSGHRLGPDHWYRQPQEGTRVCGNIGHWLDLMVHVFAWRGLPDRLEIALSWADANEPDDNISIAISSDRGDIFSVMLTARSEPFEGINETINLQHAETLCKIDDFRRMVVWQGPRVVRRRYWPKDVGHRLAILQPFRQDAHRDWKEVVLSTLLMLHITAMVRSRSRTSTFSFQESWTRVAKQIEAQ